MTTRPRIALQGATSERGVRLTPDPQGGRRRRDGLAVLCPASAGRFSPSRPTGESAIRRPSRQRGFTLVELLVALALLGLLSATLFGSLALSGRSWEYAVLLPQWCSYSGR